MAAVAPLAVMAAVIFSTVISALAGIVLTGDRLAYRPAGGLAVFPRHMLALGLVLIRHATDDELRRWRRLTRIRLAGGGFDDHPALCSTLGRRGVVIALVFWIVVHEGTARTRRAAANDRRRRRIALTRIGEASLGGRRRATVLHALCGRLVLAFGPETTTDGAVRV